MANQSINPNDQRNVTAYQITAILGVIFALVGFSYNAWRLESTEDNNNVRLAAFAVLNELAEFEQVIYFAHYDKDPDQGNPRKGWIKVGLIDDLSYLISPEVTKKSQELKHVWMNHWQALSTDKGSVTELVTHIDSVRDAIKFTLLNLD